MALITNIFYFFVFNGIPEFSELETQLIATVTTVIPVILVFSYLDYNGGSIGKRKLKLSLYFENRKFKYSLIRNTIKFLPWQIGHISVIRGIYTDFDGISIILYFMAIISLTVMLLMGIVRNDKRHLGDILADTQVQINSD